MHVKGASSSRQTAMNDPRAQQVRVAPSSCCNFNRINATCDFLWSKLGGSCQRYDYVPIFDGLFYYSMEDLWFKSSSEPRNNPSLN